MPRPISYWMDALHDSYAVFRIAAAGALGESGALAREAVPALAEVARTDVDQRVRSAAVRALGKIGPDARSAIPSLWPSFRAIAGARRSLLDADQEDCPASPDQADDEALEYEDQTDQSLFD